MYGTLICVGESVARDEKESFIFRKLDSIMVKGKDIPLNIYELVGARGSIPEATLDKIARFELALGLYQSRQFQESLKIFKDLAERYEDGPSATFADRAESFIRNGCPEDWAGHYRATEK